MCGLYIFKLDARGLAIGEFGYFLGCFLGGLQRDGRAISVEERLFAAQFHVNVHILRENLVRVFLTCRAI